MMHINSFAKCDWIRKHFETLSVMELTQVEKQRALKVTNKIIKGKMMPTRT
jgi:hypothetical protein